MASKLAIAAPNFNAVSETFIHDHVQHIAPGHTVLLCNDPRDVGRLRCPVLAQIDLPRPSAGHLQRLARPVRKPWQKYVDPGLLGTDRARVVEFLRAHTPKAVLAEYGPTGCLIAKACGLAAVPLFVHFHGYDASRLLRQPRWSRFYRRMFTLAAGIIVPSCFLAEKLAAIGCPGDKLHVSHNGIDASRFAPTRRVPDRLVAIGRLVEKKAPHSTIAAFAKISDRFPEAQLDIVGDGPLAPRCRALIGELKLEARVVLHGAQPSTFVAELLNSASVFVQHSVTAKDGDTEGFGISIVEAMASCIPVVTTRHNGFVETVEHGVTGLLVDEHDVDGMASAIAALLEDPASAAKMGEAGRERVLSNFTIERSCDRLRSIMGLAGQ